MTKKVEKKWQLDRMQLFGIVVTVVYIVFIAIYRQDSLYCLQSMPLNEFGDFFAGVFGPLMLMWVVLGYFQQQKELRQNTKVLELQVTELRNSVDQHRELVEATKQQAETERESLELNRIKDSERSKPNFIFIQGNVAGNYYETFTISLVLENRGNPASHVKVTTEPWLEDFKEIQHWKEGKSLEFSVDTDDKSQAPEKLKIVINCTDINTLPHTKEFDLVLQENYRYKAVQTATVG